MTANKLNTKDIEKKPFSLSVSVALMRLRVAVEAHLRVLSFDQTENFLAEGFGFLFGDEHVISLVLCRTRAT